MSTTVQSCSLGQPDGYACTRENGHPGPCACVPNQLQGFPPIAHDSFAPSCPLPPAPTKPYLDDSIFEGFGGNWRWATIDYRGVARVHTFEPTFTATGRIEAPRFKANSEPREAFNVVELPTGWHPMIMKRDMRKAGIKCVPTDRFGVLLPTGAHPVEAADVKVENLIINMIEAGHIDPSIRPPTYNIRRTEQCRCEISETQLNELLRRELNIPDDVELDVIATPQPDRFGIGLTVEWKRAL
jgi:hypothetical protein